MTSSVRSRGWDPRPGHRVTRSPQRGLTRGEAPTRPLPHGAGDRGGRVDDRRRAEVSRRTAASRGTPGPHASRAEAPSRTGSNPAEEAALVERLRAGNEAAFAELVERLHPAMVRLA